MDSTNRKAKKIFDQFNNEKIICGINKQNFKIMFVKSYIWVYPLFFVFGLILNSPAIVILNHNERITVFSILLGLISLSIILFISQFYTLYFEDNKIIFKNPLYRRKIFDISKYPRIYIRYRKSILYDGSYKSSQKHIKYVLYIKQNEKVMALNIRTVGSDRITYFLDSIQMKGEFEVDESQWKSSESESEKELSSLMEILNTRKKIIGVKNANNNMRIQTGSCIVLNFLKVVLVGSIILSIFLLIIKEILIASYIIAFTLVITYVLKQEQNSVTLKISYPSKNTLKIGKYLFDYKNDDIMLYLFCDENPQSNQKYDYKLIFYRTDDNYTIDLTGEKPEKIERFINNLILDDKSVRKIELI